MAKKTTSESSKRYYSNYNPEAKRRARLEKHLKEQPNDVQAQEALANASRRRKTPTNKDGWVSRETYVEGFYDKKGPHLGQSNPKTIAWVRSIIKKSEKQRQHETRYASKEERKKGGKARK